MSAATPILIESNRANAQHSTGPRSPEGKQRSARNTIRHGLFSESPILPGEDPAPFEAFRKAFIEELQPEGLLETQLLDDIAAARWRLNRCQSIENALLSAEDMEATEQVDALSRFSLYEHRLNRKYTQAVKELRALQTERKRLEAETMDQAIRVAANCKATNTPFLPSQFGFVFSAAEVHAKLNRHERLQSAKTLALFQPTSPKRSARATR